jgi:hypothetical protein
MQWTPHASAPAPHGAAPVDITPMIAAALVDRSRRFLPWVRFGFVLQPVTALLTVAAFYASRTYWREWWDSLFDGDPVRSRQAEFGLAPLTTPLSIVGTVILVMWIVRTLEAGRALGLGNKIQPWLGGLALVIPIANLFVPVVGLLAGVPRDDPARRAIGVWWALYVTSTTLAIGALIAVIAGDTAGFAVAFLAVVASAAQAVAGERCAMAVFAAHHERLRALRAR